MIGPGVAGSAFVAYASGFISGLAGLITVQVETDQGDLVFGPTTAGIIEIDTGGVNSIYRWIGTFPSPAGQYVVIWADPDDNQAAEELVTGSEASPFGSDPEPWTTPDAVAACCNVTLESSDVAVFDNAILQASAVLFRLSGRQFGGIVQRTVRPCNSWGCGFQVLSRGHIVWPDPNNWDVNSFGWTGWNWQWPAFGGCGCAPMDRVLLSGYPVSGVSEVKIDGQVVDPSTYRLDEYRYLTRVRASASDQANAWPSCQMMDLPDTEVGTWSVTYAAGQDPPLLGVSAANQLACEFYKACAGDECQLPPGTTRAIRQGITVDQLASLAFFFGKTATRGTANASGFIGMGWQTGLSLVDAFLNAYNPNGLQRRPSIWAPGQPKYARPVGSG